MELRVYGYEKNSIVDGPGIRLAIFVQGCLHHCPGCHNPGSWEMNGGTVYSLGHFTRILEDDPLITGLTLSGGEPYLQADMCCMMADIAHDLGKDVWCYTGYTFEDVMNEELTRHVDVLVDGAFEMDKRSLDIPWRGSTNQRLIDVKRSLEKGEVILYDPE